MPFLELTLHCTQSDHPRIEAAPQELGALSVTLMDADAETPDERAILDGLEPIALNTPHHGRPH